MARVKKQAEAKAEAKAEVKAEVKTEEKVLKFAKKQFVESRRFAKHKDLVNVLLKEDKTYSIKEVETLIKEFLLGNKK